MKTTLVILLSIAVAACDRIAVPGISKDPVKEMAAIAAEFPRESHFNGYVQRFSGVAYNVEKTDSLVNPLVGTLSFTDQLDLKLNCIFHWKDDRWVFVTMYNPENGIDFTATAGGVDLMSGDALRPFFEKYGWRGAITEAAARARDAGEYPDSYPPPAMPTPVATPTQRPYVIFKPQRTPTAQETAADIARKYAK